MQRDLMELYVRRLLLIVVNVPANQFAFGLNRRSIRVGVLSQDCRRLVGIAKATSCFYW